MPRYCNILLVDDHGVFREGAALQLQAVDSEISVSQAKFPDEGKEVVVARKPDLIFLDLDFGQDNDGAGLQFLRWLKDSEDYCHIPVIVMTAHELDRTQVENDLLGRGAAGYICKKVDGGASMFRAALLNLELGAPWIHGAQPPDAGATNHRNRLAVTRDLSETHLKVLSRHVTGMPYKRIATECRIADQTVADYVGEMCKLFKVKNSKALIYEIARAGVTFDHQT